MKRDFDIMEKAIINLNEKIEKLICIIYDTDLPDGDANIIYKLEDSQKELAKMWRNMMIMKSIIRKANLIVVKKEIEGNK